MFIYCLPFHNFLYVVIFLFILYPLVDI
ncbi:hypothetical protein KLEB273_gp264 [Bacillus phage vB_BauM_KLEB27-3]|nr:hypothetical protein KLEB273_gp264 [Bacillus phage vB_BauM_KLEB27-3]